MSFEFLNPVHQDQIDALQDLHHEQLGRNMSFYRSGEGVDLKEHDIAIVSCREIRNAQNPDFTGTYVESIKSIFYSLYPGNWGLSIIDLGVIEAGAQIEDTYFALRTISEECLKKDTVLICIGGSQDLTYPIYRAFDNHPKMVNVLNVDPRFDLGNIEAPINARSYIGKMVSEKPYNLYHYTNLGYQTFFNSQEEIDLLNTLFFETVRLGVLNENLNQAEPMMRDADIVTFDMQSIAGGDLAFAKANPNGLDGKQACSLSRYAGISDRSKVFSIFEIPSEPDNLSAKLIAEMVWYFIEGYSHRNGEYPVLLDETYIKYQVPTDQETLVFHKSTKSGRWWIQLPFFHGDNNKLSHHTLLACGREDYEMALKNIVPDRFLRARMKNEV